MLLTFLLETVNISVVELSLTCLESRIEHLFHLVSDVEDWSRPAWCGPPASNASSDDCWIKTVRLSSALSVFVCVRIRDWGSVCGLHVSRFNMNGNTKGLVLDLRLRRPALVSTQPCWTWGLRRPSWGHELEFLVKWVFLHLLGGGSEIARVLYYGVLYWKGGGWEAVREKIL